MQLNFNHFNSLIQVINHFSSEKNCYSFLKHQRWSDGIVRCPYCGSIHIAHRNNAKQEYRCEHCNRSFSVLAGTIFENTKLPISKWVIGMYLISSHKNGISSVQLAKDIEVTQRTAWYMLHRVRTLMKQDSDRKLSGNVECDEMYLGGRETNKHKNQKIDGTQGRSTKTKTPIFGLIETRYDTDEKGNPFVHTYARIQRVNDCTSKTLMGIIENNVEKGNKYIHDWKKYIKFTNNLYIYRKNNIFAELFKEIKVFISMENEIITEQETRRISMLTETEMLKESSTWTPSQWEAYITKGQTFDDNELDRFIEQEIIER